MDFLGLIALLSGSTDLKSGKPENTGNIENTPAKKALMTSFLFISKIYNNFARFVSSSSFCFVLFHFLSFAAASHYANISLQSGKM